MAPSRSQERGREESRPGTEGAAFLPMIGGAKPCLIKPEVEYYATTMVRNLFRNIWAVRRLCVCKRCGKDLLPRSWFSVHSEHQGPRTPSRTTALGIWTSAKGFKQDEKSYDEKTEVVRVVIKIFFSDNHHNSKRQNILYVLEPAGLFVRRVLFSPLSIHIHSDHSRINCLWIYLHVMG